MSNLANLLKYGMVRFKPNFNRESYMTTKIVVVGCGGTGGRIIPLLAQHVANHNYDVKTNLRVRPYLGHNMELVLVDMDIVEPKNLRRQNFYAFDVAKNKASVMAERYSALYGISIESAEGKFSECVEKLGAVRRGGECNFIIFDCTDNLAARKSIEDLFPSTNTLLISCGNEEEFGQVMVSTCGQGNNQRTTNLLKILDTLDGAVKEEKPGRTYELQTMPTLLEMYKNFRDTEKPSCTDMTLVNDQSMPINSLVAQCAYNVFYEITGGKHLTYNMVKVNVCNGFSTSYITSPVTTRGTLLQALFNDTSENALKAYRELSKDNMKILQANFETFKAACEKHGSYIAPYLDVYLRTANGLDSAQIQELKVLQTGIQRLWAQPAEDTALTPAEAVA
jgi:molybdopterin/thiamine biosynthesis adenylyltransferase